MSVEKCWLILSDVENTDQIMAIEQVCTYLQTARGRLVQAGGTVSLANTVRCKIHHHDCCYFYNVTRPWMVPIYKPTALTSPNSSGMIIYHIHQHSTGAAILCDNKFLSQLSGRLILVGRGFGKIQLETLKQISPPPSSHVYAKKKYLPQASRNNFTPLIFYILNFNCFS